ncbi:uncharacterized protein LOC120678573 isoform X1 [Panicum virgatum]|uniref:uncharacterized protein LOC120678573 isoform X1 n=1 Tax=Panicum virgatum TaxID=38727 RepID=UPI0019D680CE|nr:uncharacterized protein LOC120678573 isoform X1 [Panicum virgatum]
MLKMARDEQQKLLLLDLLVLVMAAPVMTLWTMGIQQYIYQDNTIRNPHMIELEEDQNTHCNDSKGKFAVTNEFSDGHQRVEPLSQWGTNGFSSGKFRVQGNCLMLDTWPSGKRGDSNAWLFAIKGARSLSEKMLPDCGFSYRNQTDMVEKIIYFLTSLSITRPWDPGVLTSFCASQHKDNYFQQCFQIVVRLPSIWTWISDLKLMESLLIVKIVGWVSDRVITCLWRVGIHDYDWLFILCFRIVYKSSALQLLLVLMPQKRNESTISLINVKYKKRLVIFSWVQPMAGVDHLRAYRWQHEPLINLITSVKLKCKVAKDLSSSSSVHWRWCDHSLIEMCQDRSAEGEELLQISIGSLWLRLEGKPHFKRRGMSRTRPLRSCCQVDQAVETEKATKGKGLGPVRGIEQNDNTIVFLLRTLSPCISGCSCFPNPSSCYSLPISSPRLYP